jgi:aspartate/methionine/tyrosine aminotransferase
MVFDDIDFSPNPIEQARRAAEGSYIDLTSSNPTQQGLLFPAAILGRAAAPYWSTRSYAPAARGALPARQAIAAYYAARTPALALDPAAIFLTASTSEAYSLLFALLTVPGDNVLGPNVTYPLFQYLADLHHIELRTYDLDPANAWRIDEGSLRAAADQRTRAVLLISPHNPTGMVVQQPIAALRQLKVPLICDEVFAPFTVGVATTPPLGTLHPELPVFHLNGISKMLALPDLKLGWIALNPPALQAYAEQLELINDTFLGCNSLIQTMLPTLLAQADQFIATMTSRVRENVRHALARFATCPRIEAALPDGGYYLFPRIHGYADDEALVITLIQAGVLVYPGFFYDYGADCRIMISCLTVPEIFAAGIERLISTLNHV